MSAPEPRAVTAQLIDELLGSGTPVDEGNFTIDSSAAAKKMKAFRYGEPLRFLVPLVEALHLLGCREIELELEGEDLSLRAANVALAEPETRLLNLYAHALGDEGGGAALARLAIAIDMALTDAVNERIALTYSNPSHSYVAVYRQHQSPALVEDHPKVIRELRLLLDRPWHASKGPRMSHSLDLLREAVRHSPRRVLLDGELISQQPREWSDQRRASGDGYRLELGSIAAREQSLAELWSGDIHVDSIPLEGRGMLAVIELDAPTRDLSHMKIVRDASLEAALAQIDVLREARREAAQPDDADPSPPDESEASAAAAAAEARAQAPRAREREDSDSVPRRRIAYDSDVHQQGPLGVPPSQGNKLGLTVAGLALYLFGLRTGSGTLGMLVGRREDQITLDDFAEPNFALLAVGWVLISLLWTAGLCYGGALMVTRQWTEQGSTHKRLALTVTLVSLVFAVVIALTGSGGMDI